MNARRGLIISAVLCATAPLFGEWLTGGTDIGISAFTVSSPGWVTYDCLFPCNVTGSHVINDYVTSYNGTVSAGTIYQHCYRARVEATGSLGASNWWGSAQACAPPDPNTLCNQSCWTTCKNGTCPPQQDIEWCTPYCSPLVLDLAGNGIRTSGG
jgi:hypothetical protein